VKRSGARSVSRKRRKVRFARVNPDQPNLVLREVDYIVARAAESDARVVSLGQLVFFATEAGDAWLLDPEDHLALRLATDGGRLPVQIVETATSYAIHWNATYRIEDDAFVVADASGTRAIIGYPVADLRVAERRALRQI
jgi:hypothetical protein